MQEVIEKGHSRVPVYYEKDTNIIGLILVMLYSAFKLICNFVTVFYLDGRF